MRAVSRLSSVAVKNRSPNSSIVRPRSSAASAASASRARSAEATSYNVPASSSRTGRAASRRIVSGFAGSTSAATASAIEPPVSASSARAKENPSLARET